ncbi:MAG TPA: hypothetical protein VLE20_00835 [Blastocatellia bacterium]|nr:hypothetical protein [Blastocatellia bacterium]
MDHEENTKPDEKRRLRVYASHSDVLVKVLDLPEGDYECVTVNSPWPERGLLEGDIVVCNSSSEGREGDIVMIEQEGQVKLGILSTHGYLQTPLGVRSLEATEQIVGVGVALSRRLSPGGSDFRL